MPPAVIAAGVATAGAIGGAVIGSKAQSKAASQANDAQQYAAQMQYQLGQESLALNKDIYNANFGVLSPFVSNGLVASNSLNALLGLPAGTPMQSPLAPPPGSPAATGGYASQPPYTQGQIAAMWNDGIPGNAEAAQAALNQWNASHQSTPSSTATMMASTAPATIAAPTVAPAAQTTTAPISGKGAIARADEDLALPTQGVQALGSSAVMPRDPATGMTHPVSGAWENTHTTPLPGTAKPTTPATPTTPTNPKPATSGTNALTPTQAFENFANSAGMQFQLQQGTNAINNLYAAKGALQSGAAMKAIQDYGQQTALQNYFMPYLGMLQGQQNMGVGAGSSIAGVGTSFGNTAAGINSQIGGAYQNSADAAANAAIANGMGQAQLWNTVGQSVGNLASSFVPVRY